MGRKLILILVIVLIVAVFFVLDPLGRKNSSLLSPVNKQEEMIKIQPSQTLKDYSDPSGFTFSYPDNLSLTKNDLQDDSVYSDIQLSSKDISGSLNLKISDSKFSTIDEWSKLNKGTVKEVKLGNLKGLEIVTSDRLILGVLDKGIFFNIEMPAIEKDFWAEAYSKVLESFSFAQTESTEAAASNDDISFEGEEIVE